MYIIGGACCFTSRLRIVYGAREARSEENLGYFKIYEVARAQEGNTTLPPPPVGLSKAEENSISTLYTPAFEKKKVPASKAFQVPTTHVAIQTKTTN